MREARGMLPTVLGVFYPRHFVVAVVHDGAQAAEAETSLRAAGFDEADIRSCSAADYLANTRAYEAQHGLIRRVAGLFPSEEAEIVKEYEEEAQRGGAFIAVHTPERAQREQASALLSAHGGHAMHYYGDATITDL